MKVKNSGKLLGDEVIQAYIEYPEGKGLPQKELRHFKRVSLTAGGEQEITVNIPVNDLKKWCEATGKQELIDGTYSLFIGGSSIDKRLNFQFNLITKN